MSFAMTAAPTTGAALSLTRLHLIAGNRLLTAAAIQRRRVSPATHGRGRRR
jgi:hypothetical protein